MTTNLKDRARSLRKNSTDVESLLWGRLRGRRLEGVKFRRQVPIGRCIVDFLTVEKRLIVELDGGQHALDKEKDAERTAVLEGLGYTVLRFWNNDVIENMEGVLDVIRRECLK